MKDYITEVVVSPVAKNPLVNIKNIKEDFVTVQFGDPVEKCHGCAKEWCWGTMCQWCYECFCVDCIMNMWLDMMERKQFLFLFTENSETAAQVLKPSNPAIEQAMDRLVRRTTLFQNMKEDVDYLLRVMYVLCYCLETPAQSSIHGEYDPDDERYHCLRVRCSSCYGDFFAEEHQDEMMLAMVSAVPWINADTFMKKLSKCVQRGYCYSSVSSKALVRQMQQEINNPTCDYHFTLMEHQNSLYCVEQKSSFMPTNNMTINSDTELEEEDEAEDNGNNNQYLVMTEKLNDMNRKIGQLRKRNRDIMLQNQEILAVTSSLCRKMKKLTRRQRSYQ